MALVDARGFQLVPDVSNLTQQLGQALGQRREQQRQDELLKQKAQAEKLQKDFKTTGAQMLNVRGLDDFTSQRSELAKLGQEAIKRGDDPTLYTDALNITNQDELNLFLTRTATAAGNADKLIADGLKESAPKPLIKEGLGPQGQPGFFAVTPEGATKVPGITPAAKAPLVTIGGDVSEEKKAIAKVQAQRFSDIMSEGRNAESTIETLDQMDAIDIKTGALEPLKASFAALAEGFGVDASGIADVTSAQALGAVSNRMVNDVLNSAKGPQTEGDAQRALKTIRSLGDDPLAGQFKSDSLRALALRKIEQADFISEEISNGKTFTAADKAWREYKNKTPNLSEVVRNPQTGLPVFFYQFKQNAKRAREGISDADIINAWRQVNAKK